jgi:general secretion pathway protein D
MKTTILALILFLTGFDLWAQTPPATNAAPRPRPTPRFGMGTNGLPAPPAFPNLPAPPAPTTPAAPAAPATPMTPALPPAVSPAGTAAATAPANPSPLEEIIPAGNINFQGVDVNQVLEVYSQLVGRTLLRAGLPQVSIVLKTETPLTKTEAIEALQAVLALNNISLVNVGDKFVKALPSDQANSAAAALDYSAATNLPELGSYVTHIVQLKYVKPSEMVPIIQPFAKLANSILPIDSNGILVLRDYAENVKRMLEMIDQVDVSVPAEYISEVIPIKYALAGDIANALSSLGGNGNATVSIGGSSSSAPISGVGTRPGGTTGTTGTGSTTGTTQSRPLGTQASPSGTPAPGTSFQQRLQAIINRAATGGGQQEAIQLFGQTKIIADQRSNSLLVFATRQDMATIKDIISKLDVLLSQVLIESAIIDYSLGPNTFNLGISAAQNPVASGNAIGGGGINNGQTFAQFMQNVVTSTNSNGLLSSPITTITSSLGTNGAFANALPGGLSYFGNIGQTWELALQAAASDSHASIIQRPRIQTSQAKPAQFFVGQTVPYVNGSVYGSAYGNSSTYSQLSVGVELDVTPFINPDGLVVMDINQEIDDINGYTAISGVGNVPNTDKRQLSSEVAVRDHDTIMLGGFIRSDKSTSRSGVPFLMNIPILGNLFTQRNDSKDRTELIVLIRPTVLRTPEIAAAQAVKEQRRLPGVSASVAEEEAAERKQVEAEQKKELRRARSEGKNDVPTTNSYAPQSQDNSFFNAPPPIKPLDTNTAAPLNP